LLAGSKHSERSDGSVGAIVDGQAPADPAPTVIITCYTRNLVRDCLNSICELPTAHIIHLSQRRRHGDPLEALPVYAEIRIGQLPVLSQTYAEIHRVINVDNCGAGPVIRAGLRRIRLGYPLAISTRRLNWRTRQDNSPAGNPAFETTCRPSR
jgi:hypothetical protein